MLGQRCFCDSFSQNLINVRVAAQTLRGIRVYGENFVFNLFKRRLKERNQSWVVGAPWCVVGGLDRIKRVSKLGILAGIVSKRENAQSRVNGFRQPGLLPIRFVIVEAERIRYNKGRHLPGLLIRS